MKVLPSLGEQETEVLSFVCENTKVSVREAAVYFEEHKGLARTTVLTVMERLRKKGYLVRDKEEGLFVYTAKIEAKNILKSKVGEFVEKTLGGSISPLLNYFAENKNISPEELNQLQQILKNFNEPEKKKTEVKP